ncbi:MAG: hypothetical protein K6A70_10670 [Erysipelotrichaceae bacterium]|jgi:acyl carrier protein|nr:hypothetical protein [Erysipelotrichaceae bacterium]
MNVEILKQLEEIIHDYKGSKDLQISEDSSLIRDLELSSLDIINLVGIIEDTFNIEIDDLSLASMRTVKDVVEYIQNNK